jgi:hypothetical protein
MKFLSFPMTLAGAIVCGVIAAACTAPPIGAASSDSAVSGGGNDGTTPTKKSAPATKSPSAQQQTGDDDDDNGGPPSGGKKDPTVCMKKCIASNADAQKMYGDYASCESSCKPTDSSCDAKCNSAADTACNAAPDACQVVDGCASKCPNAPGGSGGTGGGSLTFADVQSILANACASCHHHQGQFATLADVQAAQQDILAKIQSGDMPQGDDGSFAQSPDGQKLLNWLQSGTDLQ